MGYVAARKGLEVSRSTLPLACDYGRAIDVRIA